MPKKPSTDVQKFREVVKSSRNIIAIAGAGLSAASGDYRSEYWLMSPFISIAIRYLQVYLLSAMAEDYGGSMKL
jgi:NAD-dependent SIR2 family protein deacetylase